MESHVSPSFWHDFRKAPRDIRRAALNSYRRFKVDPWQEALEFKNIKRSLWSVRIVDNSNTRTGWRCLGMRIGDTVYWDFMGDHGAYEVRIKNVKG